ncbi:MAG: glycosyltransferase family 4 protein [Balneolaceae bacterium]
MEKQTNTSGKILMTVDTLGGVWTYAMELIQALERYNVHVVLATMGRQLNSHQKLQLSRLENVETEESCFRLEWMRDPWEDVDRAGNWLMELEKKHSPDLIHLNNYVHAGLPFIAPKIVIAHSDIYSWWNQVKGGLPPAKFKKYHRKVQQGLQKADLVIAPTQAMLNCVNTFYRASNNQKVISNARSDDKFGAASKKPFIFSIGRIWDEAKNIKLLEKVAAKCKWPVFIAGEDQHPEERSSCQFEHLHFLGRLSEEETAKWLAQASVYVMPAKYEPFGLSVLEAGLSSCALVLGDIDSLRENWDGAAFFIDPEKPESLEKILYLLQQDSSLRTAIAGAANQRAKTFTPEKMASEYMGVYQKLLEETGRNFQPLHHLQL